MIVEGTFFFNKSVSELIIMEKNYYEILLFHSLTGNCKRSTRWTVTGRRQVQCSQGQEFMLAEPCQLWS